MDVHVQNECEIQTLKVGLLGFVHVGFSNHFTQTQYSVNL